MALLEARVSGDVVAIDGYSVPWPLSAVGLGKRVDRAKVTVGLWPEDIAVATAEAPGFVPVTISATDFRGRDQAIEVRFGVNRIRKVIPIRTTLARGENCFIRTRSGEGVHVRSFGRRPNPRRLGLEPWARELR